MKNQRLLLLGSLLLAAPTAVEAQFNYAINSNLTITITGYTGLGGAVAIPATISGLMVSTIGTAAFQASTNLASVAFPDSVTSIGDYAFNACGALTNVTIGNGVTNIGYHAFGFCSNLTRVSIPDSVVSLGKWTFYYSGVKSVTVGNGITDIGGAFQYCTSLVAIFIGKGMASFPQYPFIYCGSLLTINVATNNPFYSSVDGVLFDKTQSTIVLCPVARAGTYTIPNTVTSIALQAFSGCSGLTNILIPDSVTYIGVAAFSGSGLLSVRIPNSVTNIGSLAFESCRSLASLSIGQNVGSIGDWAFEYCTSLTNVTIPDSVTNLGNAAFAICSNLVDLNISKRLNSIGGQAFSLCPSLGNVTIPNSVIGYLEFESCLGLTNVTIGPGVTSIDQDTFLDCSNLTAVYFQGNAPAATGISGVLSGGDHLIIYYWPGTTGWGSTFAGRPALPINVQIAAADSSFGVLTNQFGFNVTGTYGLTFVVEAATNLIKPTWSPVQTNTLTGSSSYFSDPPWADYPGRFCRVRWP